MPQGRREGIIQLFEAEPDLLAHLPPAEAEIARERTVVSQVDMPASAAFTFDDDTCVELDMRSSATP